jgi:UDP-N-acetylglucosamine/UDP-N-acetylgalactosamine diphosphorylase
MTSPANDAPTRAFIQDNRCFGLDRRNIFMFPQGTIPSIEAETGKLLLTDKGRVAVNPDGHGGSIKALVASGAIDAMLARGVEHLSYFQVDNPLVKVIDPLFIGLHAAAPDSSGEMSSKMVPKTSPDEKVGILCRVNGKTIVIEYSDPPDELAQQRDDDGRLRFSAGSIAVHMLGVKFVKKLASGKEGFALPYHRATKIVPYVDTKSAELIQPQKPNAVKMETLVFDALPLAESSIVYETSRLEEFAPIKNAQGNDSPATSHQLQSDRAGQWLEAHGVAVPRDAEGHVSARIEISPLTALEPNDLAKLDLPDTIEPGQTIAL